MRIDLALQRLHARMQQQPFLFLQLDLNADAVENFELNSNGGHRRGIDRRIDPIVSGTLQTEDGAWKIPRQFGLHKAQADNRDEEYHLPIKQARPLQVTPN